MAALCAAKRRGEIRQRCCRMKSRLRRMKPAGAGFPHPSRCSAKAQRRATFPKGKARVSPCGGFPQEQIHLL